MLDGLSLDLLRILVAAMDEGSFSAAGRRIGRSQSVVSQAIAHLEAQLSLALFERSGRYPVPTEQGQRIAEHARAILRDVDGLKTHARAMAGDLEPELSVVLDVFFPQDRLTAAVTAFAARFPHTALRLHVEALGAVVERVLAGDCSLGIAGTLPLLPPSLEREYILDVALVTVVSPASALAAHRGVVPLEVAAEHIQLVLTDRSSLTAGQDFGVLVPRTWRLADLGAKHAFLRAGLGWGNMPRQLVEADLAAGTLVSIRVAGSPEVGMSVPMMAIYPADARPGLAGRWLVEQLRT